MELKTVIQQRTSIRVFKDEKVPIHDLKEMVRLAGLAPSVNNYQPWKYIAITNKEVLNQIADQVAKKISALPLKKTVASKNIITQVTWFSTFFKDAPAVLVLVIEPYVTVLESGVEISHDEINRIRNYPDIQSAGASIQNLLLSAVDMGYAACWLSGPLFAKSEIEEILGIKPPSNLLAFIAVGKPRSKPQPKEKPNLADTMVIID
jgi:nitroreductase